MPIFERRAFIDILMEENNKIKENREREMKIYVGECGLMMIYVGDVG